MFKAIVVTPVKDSIENTMDTIKAIHASEIKVQHLVYNDFSSEATKQVLEDNESRYSYELIHLENLTSTPSPNYKLVLQDAQRRALEAELPLIIVESDVEVKPDTFGLLLAFDQQHERVGLVGAITVGHDGNINFPYLRFKDQRPREGVLNTKKSLSFCCTLISLEFLMHYGFASLKPSKDWFDTFISKQALTLGFSNFLLYDVPVLHKPHGSRPWKQLKYTNPFKYYLLKLIKRRDKI